MSNRVVFSAQASDKRAPVVDTSKVRYASYFENMHRERLIYAVDQDGRATLWHSDMDWRPVLLEPFGILLLVMEEEEWRWLHLCWEVSRWARNVPAGTEDPPPRNPTEAEAQKLLDQLRRRA